MKQTHLIILFAIASSLLLTGAASKVDPPEITTRGAMRAKIVSTHQILEGIATENYSQIETNAQKLIQLSKVAGWRARQTPEYDLFTNEFRRHAEALVESAQNKNIDGATLAYMQLAFNCASCHKHMRGLRRANLVVPSHYAVSPSGL